jgi:hypothetical protein
LADKAGQVIRRTAAFADGVIGNLRAGSITAQDVATQNLTAQQADISAASIGTLEAHGLVIANAKDEPVISFDEEGNATFAGTVTAEHIKAGSIEGLDVLADAAVASQLAALSPVNGTDTVTAEIASDPLQNDFDTLQQYLTFTDKTTTILNSLVVDKDMRVEGDMETLGQFVTRGLVVSGTARFKSGAFFAGTAQFDSSVAFREDVLFEGRPTFNSDSAGFATIKKGDSEVEVTFAKEYTSTPVVTAGIALDANKDEQVQAALEEAVLKGDVRLVVTKRGTKGFTIKLNKPATVDLAFSWTAIAVKDAKTYESSGKGAIVLVKDEKEPALSEPAGETVLSQQETTTQAITDSQPASQPTEDSQPQSVVEEESEPVTPEAPAVPEGSSDSQSTVEQPVVEEPADTAAVHN